IWQSPYRAGVIEEYVSGPSLARMYKSMTGMELTGKEVAERALSGEEAALDVFAQFADGLVFALAWTLNTVDPDAVILGGSVVNSADLFLSRVRTLLPKYLSEEAAQHIDILTAGLGNNAGFMGAAALMFED
ncbi:MAG: ROK family protein, partial [Muribaculaceae bacterium]|nr:ROK family protein [Muribaculaceae bacterium]